MAEIARTGRSLARPPYAPLTGVVAFFEQAKGKVAPPRIDRAYLASIGIAAGNEQHLVVTLKFLGIIDNAGQPGRYFPVLYMKGPDRKRGLQNMLRQAYPSLFTGELDLASANRAELHDHVVKRYGVQGQIARKATSLFVLLCTIAEVPLSADILHDSKVAVRRRSKGARPESERLRVGPSLSTGTTLSLLLTLTPDMTDDQIVTFLRRVKRAISVVEGDVGG